MIFEFNLWSDLIWPMATEFVWVPIVWFVYKRWTIYRKNNILAQLSRFQNDIITIYNKGSKEFDREATIYVNAHLVKFAKFLSVIGEENIDIPGAQKGWNNNNKLNKFRQFYFYLSGTSDITKYK